MRRYFNFEHEVVSDLLNLRVYTIHPLISVAGVCMCVCTHVCILCRLFFLVKTATALRSPWARRSLFRKTSIVAYPYYGSQTATMRAREIQSGKCYLHRHGEFDRDVDVQSSNNTVPRCFSFPPSLKCPFLPGSFFEHCLIAYSLWPLLSFRLDI